MRTPYNKEVRAAPFARYFASRGYVVVVQDVRGRYRSQGRWRPLSDDGRDGYDTTQWIGHHSWSDGGIGTVGTSYEGGTQHALAIAAAPFVKAMIPLFSMSDVGRYGLRHNGAFELRWVNWVLSMGDPGGPPNLVAAARAASDPAAAPALADLVNHVPEYVRALPLRAGDTPLKFAPDYEEWLTAVMSHGGDDPVFKGMGVEVVDHLADYKDIPVYHVTGWYDSWALQVANLNYVGLHERKKSPQRLIVGPWTHSRPNASYAGDAQFTPDAAIDLNAFQQRCRPTLWTCTDSNPLSARNDVLVFQTPPLTRDLEVTGRLIVRLWAASDSPDTDFTAKLIDVYPPSADFPGGIELNIGDSIVRARYRNGPGRAEMLQPGKPYEFTIEMYPTSLVFRHGHRIRLDISSSNFPRFDVNPNTGEPLNDNRRWRIAENSVYFDPAHPSRIELPLIPTGSP